MKFYKYICENCNEEIIGDIKILGKIFKLHLQSEQDVTYCNDDEVPMFCLFLTEKGERKLKYIIHKKIKPLIIDALKEWLKKEDKQ